MKQLAWAVGISVLLAVGLAILLSGVVSVQSRTLVAGTKTVTTTASTLVTGGAPCVELWIQNDALSGSGSLAIGDVSGQFFKLAVGDYITIAIDDLVSVYVKAVNTTGTQVVNYICRKN